MRNAELTYALDGRIFGVELPTRRHGRDFAEQQLQLKSH